MSQPQPASKRSLAHRISEHLWEWRLGVQTLGLILPEELALPPGGKQYTPTPYRGFMHLMSQVPAQFTRGCFVDFGCGMGRTLVLAKKYFPFTRAVGVEFNAQLCQIARANTHSLANVEIIQTDARSFAIPQDASTVFLFNPFGGEVLRQVVANIEAAPRELMVAVCNYREFLQITRMPLIAKGEMSPRISWALFHLNAPTTLTPKPQKPGVSGPPR